MTSDPGQLAGGGELAALDLVGGIAGGSAAHGISPGTDAAIGGTLSSLLSSSLLSNNRSTFNASMYAPTAMPTPMPTTAMPTPAGRVACAVQTDQSGSQPIELDCGEGWVIAGFRSQAGARSQGDCEFGPGEPSTFATAGASLNVSAECHYSGTLAKVEAACLGEAACTLDVNEWWPARTGQADPCYGTVKRLGVSAECAPT